MMLAIQKNVQVGDYVIFSSTNANGKGEIVFALATTIRVKIVKEMDSSILQHFNILPITSMDFPLASEDGLVEVYKTQR
jgi:hypothetical protein